MIKKNCPLLLIIFYLYINKISHFVFNFYAGWPSYK